MCLLNRANIYDYTYSESSEYDLCKINLKIFNQYFDNSDELVKYLSDFDVLCLMRERTVLSASIIEKLTKLKIKKIHHSRIHGWLYSSNSKPLKQLSLWNKSLKLGLCGDYFGGPRLENGWQSAVDLFNKIDKIKI